MTADYALVYVGARCSVERLTLFLNVLVCRHLYWTIPLAAVLSFIYWPLRAIVDAYRLGLLLVIAVVYTIPWDSYLIRTSVSYIKRKSETLVANDRSLRPGVVLPTFSHIGTQILGNSSGGAVLLRRSDVYHIPGIPDRLEATPTYRVSSKFG